MPKSCNIQKLYYIIEKKRVIEPKIEIFYG